MPGGSTRSRCRSPRGSHGADVRDRQIQSPGATREAAPRIALVTGANRGLGLETSRQLLAKGLTVVLAGRDDAALDRARLSLDRAWQQRALTVRLDVTDVDSIAAAHQMVTDVPVPSTCSSTTPPCC